MKNRVVLKTELATRNRELTPAQLAERQGRLDSVVHRILYASYMSMPAALRKKWKGGLAIDGTPIRQFTRGRKKNSKWAPCDPDCGWYVRQEEAAEGSQVPNYKKLFFGLEASLAIMCGDDLAGTANHPNLVLGMRVDRPGFRMGEHGTRIAEQVARRTGLTGWLAGDRLYSNLKAENFQLPTRALGYRHVFDYMSTQLGNRATYGHAIQVEGHWYCDCMPKALIDATKHYRLEPDDENKIGKAAWQARLVRRRNHAMRVKERRADGSVRFSSRCCRSKPSVTIPVEVGAKCHQELEFGMPDHQARYALMRNTNEGFNGTSKDGSHAGLDQASRRRKRGIAAQSLLCAALLFAENMRRIASFEDKAVADADGQLVKKRAGRPRRRALDDYVPGGSDDAPPKVVTPRYGDPPEE